MPGEKYAALSEVPDISPPPPTGATRASSGPASSINSFAQVACPAMTRSSLYGWTKAAPERSTMVRNVLSRASWVGSQNVISAPYPATASIFTRGEVLGITT